MGKMHRSLIFIASLILFSPCILAGKEITIRIWLFQGILMEDQPQLKQVEIMPLSTSPELESLKALAGGPENSFKAAVIDALLDVKNLQTLDDLFLFKQTQNEDVPFPVKVILGRQIAYRINLFHKILAPTQVALRIVLSKTKAGVIRPEKNDRTMLRNAFNAAQDDDKLETIMDHGLVIGFDDPVVVGVPYQNHPYFMVIKLTANEREIRPRTSPTLKVPPVPNLVPAPRPVDKILPFYSDELIRLGIRGDVGLQITIDEKGNVQMVQVMSSLHPYLDYTASQAFWQWKFEPVHQKGKPIRAAFNYTFNFDPRLYSEGISQTEETPASEVDAVRKELARILGGCAEYCQKLADAALFFTCEEAIKEITYSLISSDRLPELLRGIKEKVWEDSGGYSIVAGYKPQIMDTKNIQRNIYQCDYQLIRRAGEIEERRIVLKINGRRITDRIDLLEEKRYSILAPIFASLKVLDKDHQSFFNYRILKEDKAYGKNVYIIEALPKLGDEDGVRSAKFWLDKEHFQILRSEIEGVPLEGYEDVLREAVFLNIRPFFLTTYEFRVEKNGLFFPQRTTVKVEYPSLMPNRRETKSKIDLTYKNFRFFMVETSYEIRK